MRKARYSRGMREPVSRSKRSRTAGVVPSRRGLRCSMEYLLSLGTDGPCGRTCYPARLHAVARLRAVAMARKPHAAADVKRGGRRSPATLAVGASRARNRDAARRRYRWANDDIGLAWSLALVRLRGRPGRRFLRRLFALVLLRPLAHALLRLRRVWPGRVL